MIDLTIQADSTTIDLTIEPVAIAGAGLPQGGSASQVLSKIDGDDYSVEWSTPSGGGGGSFSQDYDDLLAGDMYHVAGVLKNTGGLFAWLENSAHATINVLPTVTTTSSDVTINYPTASKVVMLIVSCDETYTSINAGASVGLSSAVIKFYGVNNHLFYDPTILSAASANFFVHGIFIK